MRVGLGNVKYPERRCIITNKKNTYINYKKYNSYSYSNYFGRYLNYKPVEDYIFKPLIPEYCLKADIFHFFNQVGILKKPWITTFETSLPRVSENFDSHRGYDESKDFLRTNKTKLLLGYIAQDNCKALIALSECAYKIQKALLFQYPEVYDLILPKIKIIHPPQKIIIDKIKPNKNRSSGSKIHFLFVGNDFYRKGGGEIILAFQKLLKENFLSEDSFHLTMVGDINRRTNYVHNNYGDEDSFYSQVELSIKYLKEKKCLSLFGSLNNDDILALMTNNDIGLLPTWGDTYGYSVLEMQACGCPVITTNVRAMYEINPSNCGWLINLPLNKFNEIVVTSNECRDIARASIIEGLIKIVKEIANDNSLIESKGTNCIEKIAVCNSHEKYNMDINGIYDSI